MYVSPPMGPRTTWPGDYWSKSVSLKFETKNILSFFLVLRFLYIKKSVLENRPTVHCGGASRGRVCGSGGWFDRWYAKHIMTHSFLQGEGYIKGLYVTKGTYYQHGYFVKLLLVRCISPYLFNKIIENSCWNLSLPATKPFGLYGINRFVLGFTIFF